MTSCIYEVFSILYLQMNLQYHDSKLLPVCDNVRTTIWTVDVANGCNEMTISVNTSVVIISKRPCVHCILQDLYFKCCGKIFISTVHPTLHSLVRVPIKFYSYTFNMYCYLLRWQDFEDMVSTGSWWCQSRHDSDWRLVWRGVEGERWLPAALLQL